MLKQPLTTYEENRNDENFDEARNLLKVLMYLTQIFVVEETELAKSSKGKVNAGKARNKKKTDTINFENSINSINKLFSLDLHYLWKHSRKIEKELISCLYNICFPLLQNPNNLKNADLKEGVYELLRKAMINPHKEQVQDETMRIVNRIVTMLFEDKESASAWYHFIILVCESEPNSDFPKL